MAQGKWTEKEFKFLEENKDRPQKELAEILGRSVAAISDKIRKINGPSGRVYKNLDDKEIEYIKNHYQHDTIKDISTALDRQFSTILQFCNKMGWRKKEEPLMKKGESYGQLTALEDSYIDEKLQRSVVRCICSCQKEWLGPVHALKSGNTESCGHLVTETSRANGKKNLFKGAPEIGEKYGDLEIKSTPYCREGDNEPVIDCYCYGCNSPDLKAITIKHWGKTNSCGCARSRAQTDETRAKVIATNIERYGCEAPLQNKEVMDKLRKTNELRYGYKNVFQNTEIKIKSRETCLEKYGTETPQISSRVEEKSIQEFLFKLGFEFNSTYKILDGKQIDLYNEELKIGIEYCGLYWHHENSKSPITKTYHYSKYKKCKDKDIRLITIFSDEWLKRRNQVKDFLRGILGIFSKRIYGRKCVLKEVDLKIAKEFVNNNHVQELKRKSKVVFGLYYEDELVGLSSLNLHHRDNTKIVLDRICFKSNVQIVGGVSKLISRCVKWCKDSGYSELITWSDNRWSDGTVYEKCGFRLDKELKQDYQYVKLANPQERYSKQSMKKSNVKCPSDKTEKEYLFELGYSRIWDCGKKRFVYDIK